jgi:excisionase family DNA binding protein
MDKLATTGLLNRWRDIAVRESVTRDTKYEMLPDYLTPNEARAYLNLGRSTLYELVKRGELPAVRFGKILRIPREALKK